jgi:hypothetical protein
MLEGKSEVVRRSLACIVACTIALVFSGCPSPSQGPSAGPVDLVPSSITYSVPDVLQNAGTSSPLPVSLTIRNLQSGSVSKTFSVDFYLTLSSTFLPSTDALVGSASVAGIGGNASIVVAPSLNIPSGVSNSLITNNCVYIYAVVDPAGVTGDINTSNNISTPATAAVVLVYGPSPTYTVTVETYAGSGSGTNNTELTLYQYVSGTTVLYQGDNKPLGSGQYGALPALTLPSGTYYALVSPVAGSSGPYAINVRTANIDQVRVPDLSTDPSTGNDNALTLGTLSSYSGPPPGNGQAMIVGNAVSWYLASGTRDWFTFTLP